MSEDLWYVKLSNGDVHRVTLDQLDGAFQAGQIDESTLVLGAETDEWMKLGDLLGGDDDQSEGAEEPSVQTDDAGWDAPAHAYAEPTEPAYAAPVQQAYGYAQPVVQAAPAQAYSYAQPSPSVAPATPYGYAAPQANSIAPMASSLRPMSFDLGEDDADLYPKKSKKPFVAAVLACAAIAGAIGFVATRSHGSGDDITSVAAAAAMMPPHAAAAALPDPTPAPPPPPVAAAPAPAPAPVGAAHPSSEGSPMNPQFTTRLNEDQKVKLVAADKAHEQKVKAKHGGGGGGGVSHPAPKAKSMFTTGGNKFDPLNSSI